MAKWLKDPFIISLILLAIVGGTIGWLKFKPHKKEPSLYLGSSVDKIDKIEIDYQENKTVLKKNNNQWVVETENNQIADSQLVDDLLAKLKQLKPVELVSQNSNNQSKYGVDQSQAVRLLVYKKGQKLLELFVGNTGPSFDNHYIRRHNQNKVYLSNIPIKSALLPADSWVKSQENNQEENSAK
jgi:hypothetical protein